MAKKPPVSAKPHKNAGKPFMHNSGSKTTKGKGC